MAYQPSSNVKVVVSNNLKNEALKLREELGITKVDPIYDKLESLAGVGTSYYTSKSIAEFFKSLINKYDINYAVEIFRVMVDCHNYSFSLCGDKLASAYLSDKEKSKRIRKDVVELNKVVQKTNADERRFYSIRDKVGM